MGIKNNMSTTRHLIENWKYIATIKKLTPSKSLVIQPMPCEIKAAEIRNKAVDGIMNNNIGEITYRYLQSNQGKMKTATETVSYLALIAMLASHLFKDNDINYAAAFFILFSIANILPNINNALRYSGTQELCKEWLCERLGKQKVEKIQKMQYTLTGMLDLTAFLKEEKIDASNVELNIQKFY